MTRARRLTRFEDWHSHDVEKLLGVQLRRNWPPVDEWVATETEWPAEHRPYLELIHRRLYTNHANWNEMELQFFFIGPFMLTVQLHGEGFSSFAQRPLAAEVGGYKVRGYVDWMTASGSYEPYKPYFFLHEYKRQKASEADPLGQLLISMVAAQTLNDDGLPVYGCFVIGRSWSFVLLHGKEYSFSQAFDSLDEGELGRIWHTLHRTRELIAQRVAAEQQASSR